MEEVEEGLVEGFWGKLGLDAVQGTKGKDGFPVYKEVFREGDVEGTAIGVGALAGDGAGCVEGAVGGFGGKGPRGFVACCLVESAEEGWVESGGGVFNKGGEEGMGKGTYSTVTPWEARMGRLRRRSRYAR